MILEAVVAGGGTFSTLALIAFAVHRPERRERRECERLHHVADLEREVYGDVVSSDAAEHVAVCGRRPAPPPGRGAASTPLRWGSAGDFGRAVEAARRHRITVTATDVERFRQLVAECEAIKRLIQDVEDFRVEKPSPLVVAGIDPRVIREKERLAELRSALKAKRQQVEAMARAWESDPQTGPGATRIC